MSNGIPLWKKELILALSLLLAGLSLLPVAIYLVGAELAGEYQGDGLWGLFRHIAEDLSRGKPFAWLLVLAPYLMVQLARLGLAVFRARRDVTEVPVSE